jgi:two-component system phosphate regulon sensor histidine kinase PhoR
MAPVFWFRSQIFWKILGAYAGLSLLAMVGMVVTLDARIEANQKQQLESDAASLCSDVATSIGEAADPLSALEQWKSIAAARRAELLLIRDQRATAADAAQLDCSVLVLNSVVREARRSGITRRWISLESDDATRVLVGLSLRFDETSAAPAMVVVVAQPADLANRVSQQIQPVATSAAFMWLIGCLCVALVSGGLVIPLRSITRDVRVDVDQSRRKDTLMRISDRADEIGEVADSLNQLEHQRDETILQIKTAEKEARFTADLLSVVMQSMVEGVLAFDRDERILFLNESARAMLQVNPQLKTGARIYEAVRQTVLQDAVRDVLSTGLPQTAELKMPRGGAYLALSLTPFHQAQVHGGVLVIRDVSELRQLESIRRDFVAGVSHELKTPLTAIQVCTDTLVGGALEDPDAARHFLSQIDEHAERLMQLILGMLQLARVEAGKEMFNPVPVLVDELVDDLVHSFGTVAQNRGIALRRVGEFQEPVVADPSALQTVISNLIDNALKHTPDGGTVTVEISETEKSREIHVRDTGPGIPPEHIDRVFERFYRVDRDRSRSRGGMGLGLAIVKHLCQPMNAQCSVASQPGKGCVFTIRFSQSATPSATNRIPQKTT